VSTCSAVSETGYTRDLSALIGEHDRPARSVTTPGTGRTITHKTRLEPILDVATLAALPKVLLAAGVLEPTAFPPAQGGALTPDTYEKAQILS